MAEMTAALAAMNLGSHHPVTAVDGFLDRPVDRRVEARPAGAALELAVRYEERLAAART